MIVLPLLLMVRLPPDNAMMEAVRRKIMETVKYMDIRLYIKSQIVL